MDVWSANSEIEKVSYVPTELEIESFNSKLLDELLNGEIFLHIDELRHVGEWWRKDYNHYRPHSSLGYMTPAEYAKLCEDVGCFKRHKQRSGRAELCETFSQRVD